MEDEKQLANSLKRGLEEEGHAVEVMNNGEEAELQGLVNDYDLVILDWRLPAHELMTPLASLQSEAEITLRKSRSEKAYRETIRRMLAEVRRMSEMVHLLLQLSRVESEHRARAEIINMSCIAETVAGKYEKEAREKNINLGLSIDPELYIRAEGTYMEKVMTNLLENALKYTSEGGSIRIRLQRSGSKAELQISDSGIGFDPETKHQLFERFYRANESDVQQQPGSGLGLSLVKAIVELYEGKIHAYSKGPDGGSTFVVELSLVEGEA